MKNALPLFFCTLFMSLFWSNLAQAQLDGPPEIQYCHHAPNPIDLHPLTPEQVSARAASNERSDTFDIIHTNIALEVIDFIGQNINGSCEIDFSPKEEGVTVLPLDLLKLNIDSILVNNQITTYNYNDTLLLVDLPQAFPITDTATVIVYYGGKPTFDPSGFGGFVFASGYAYNLGIGLSSNPYNYGRSWFPCFDNFVERSTYEFHISSSNGRKAYCIGTFLGEVNIAGDTIRRSYEMMQPLPTYLVGIAVSDYQESNSVHTAVSGDLPFQLVARSNEMSNMMNTFVDLGAAVDALESWYGPYQWDRVGYVSTTQGAMEHPTNIAFPNFVLPNGNNFANKRRMAHELAHCWWGDVVTLSTPSDMWFKEGNAEYGAHLVTLHIDGQEAFIKQVKDNFLDVIKTAHTDDGAYLPLSGIPYENTYGTHTYSKGASMIHNLRAYMGDDLFSSSMTDILNHFSYQSIDAAQFRDRLMETSGVDLTSYFDDWIYAPGYVGYEINSMDITPNMNSTVEIEQKLRVAPNFHTNVPIEITFLAADGNRHTELVMVSDQISEVQVNVPFEPVGAWLNGNHKLNIVNFANEHTFTAGGIHLFPHGSLQVVVTETSGEAFLRVEHAWIPPDVPQNVPPETHISNSHYWKIDGILPNNFVARADFNYRGLQGTLLDADLTSVNEDSIVLVYRKNPSEEWQLYEPAMKVAFTPTDGQGFIRADSIRLGEYAFANGEFPEMVGNQQPASLNVLKVFPNPGSGLFLLSGQVNDNRLLSCKVFDSNGRLIKGITLGQQNGKWTSQVDLSELPNGTYLLHIEDSKQELMATQKVILQK